jgi:streptogramin lyase
MKRLRGARSWFSLLGVFCLADAGLAARAQTAPQLLPYTVKVVAGGGASAIGTGATCPVSGFTSADAYGDGCLATEIQLTGPRYAVADKNGNIFFGDYTNGLVRRIDANSGIVTTVAGGASSSPASGATCGSLVSVDSRGDGCLGTAVKLSHPVGLVFSPSGDLYFGDSGYANVRKIAATSGLITTSGVISLVAGNVSGTYGYASNFGSTTINAATQGYLDGPFGLAFDAAGNLYIADEYKNAVLALNTNTTGSTTVTGVTIPAGTIAKILGSVTAGGTVCPNSPATTNGCNYGLATFNGPANSSETDTPYGVAVDPNGNVYFSGEYDNYIGKISTSGLLTSYAGVQGAAAKKLVRGTAGSFGIGSPFGIVADSSSNVYFADASSGVIWRVDAAGLSQYVVAGGATAICSAATDTYGDGCPATQAKFGSSGSGNFATASNPGVFGVTVDANSNLFVGDSITGLVREVSSGTQFGTIGANQPTQTVAIHFATSDMPASAGAYTLTAGASNFSLGTAVCTTNSDATVDCLLPVTATPSVLGPFSGTLQVKSSLGATASFLLSGVYAQSPLTRTTLTASGGTGSCSGTTTYATTAPITLTATVVSTGTPSGTVTFYANGAVIGTPHDQWRGDPDVHVQHRQHLQADRDLQR